MILTTMGTLDQASYRSAELYLDAPKHRRVEAPTRARSRQASSALAIAAGGVVDAG